MNAIEIKNLSKKFEIRKGIDSGKGGILERLKIRSPKKRTIWALKDISLKVKEGEWLGIVGENGSGKTTLLKLIGNVMKPTEGSVETNGKIASILGLGTGFKDDLTARENVYLYSSLMGLSRDEIEKKYKDIVSFAELYDYMDTKFKKFSDGMKMRLAFSTAMNVEADIFLSDEVLTVGDGEFQKKCLQKMKEFKERDKTIVFVSHSLSSIKKWCDRVVFLDDGKIRDEGDVDEVLSKYRRFLVWKGKNEEYKEFKNNIGGGPIENLTFYNENHKESYIFNRGEYFSGEILLNDKCKKVKIKFVNDKSGDRKLTIYSKDIEEVKEGYKCRFEIESLWLDEGQYKVLIEVDDEDLCELNLEILEDGKRRLNLIVLNSPENNDEFPKGKYYILGSNKDLKEEYQRGLSIPVYEDIDNVDKLKEKFEEANVLK